MRYVFPSVFRLEPEGCYSVVFPDIKRGATQGDTIAECIEMAEDFLCLALYDMEEEGKDIPLPTDIRKMTVNPDDVIKLISVDTEYYRRFNENKVTKKTLTIPSWLNVRAKEAKINFSQTLQNALINELRITK
jgi:predicted RNase H-like HicB family nuclease